MSPYTGRSETVTGVHESRAGRIRNLFQMGALQRWFRNNTDCHGKAKTQHWKVLRKGSTSARNSLCKYYPALVLEDGRDNFSEFPPERTFITITQS